MANTIETSNKSSILNKNRSRLHSNTKSKGKFGSYPSVHETNFIQSASKLMDEKDNKQMEERTYGSLLTFYKTKLSQAKEALANFNKIIESETDVKKKQELNKNLKTINEIIKAFESKVAETEKLKEKEDTIEEQHTNQEQLRKENVKKINQEEKNLKEKLKEKGIEKYGLILGMGETSDDVNHNQLLQTSSKKITKNLKSKQVGYGITIGPKLVRACLDGVFDNLPPTFCYIKHGNLGSTSYFNTPHGYYPFGLIFYKHCNAGYTNVAGVCWQNCASGYSDLGLTCNTWWHMYFKHSYVAHTISFLDHTIQCRDNGDKFLYKSGALCYKDCKRLALFNCGIGACSADGLACAHGIITMVAEIAVGVAMFVALIVTIGQSAQGAQAGLAGAKVTIQGIMKAIGSKVKFVFTLLKRIAIDGVFRKIMLKKIAKWVALKVTTKVITGIQTFAAQKVCEQVGNDLFDKMKTKPENTGFDPTSLDFTGIADAVKNCEKLNRADPPENDQINCAKSIMGAVAFFDPTGLMVIATALVQPLCDLDA